jgi:predicted O-methyltransferase YrrM
VYHSYVTTLRRCLKLYLAPSWPTSGEPVRVLHIGGDAERRDATRGLIERVGGVFTSREFPAAGPLQLADAGFDVVVGDLGWSDHWLSGGPHPTAVVDELIRATSPHGTTLVIGRAEHEDDEVAERCGTHLVDAWTSPFGPRHDRVEVFRHEPSAVHTIRLEDSRSRALDDVVQNDIPDDVDPTVERRSGRGRREDFLMALHRDLAPGGYLEIGVEYGTTLAMAHCPAVGIDPCPAITAKLAERHQLARMTSEDFFELERVDTWVPSIDLALIDGLHRLENALLDFMYVERHAHPGTVILVDDVFPNNVVQARRQRESRHWVGDVWKIAGILDRHRPDLMVIPVDTEPTGMLMVLGADPTSTTLWNVFDDLLERELPDSDPPQHVIDRLGSWAPDDRLLGRLILAVTRGRQRRSPPSVGELRSIIESCTPRQVVAL